MSFSGRGLAATALAACLAAVALVVLWPTHPNTSSIEHAAHEAFAALAARGVPASLLRNGEVEFAGNVLLFAPLGLLGALALPRRLWWIAPIACLALSGCVETAQLVFLHGRSFAVRDIVANTSGGVIGTATGLAVRSIASRIVRRAR